MVKNLREPQVKSLNIVCPVATHLLMMPMKYTCDGSNVSPPLDISGIPEEALTLAIIMEDLQSPVNKWVHWLVWNIPITNHLKENKIIGIEGLNDFCKNFYCGPCPYYGRHQYSFKIYALDTLIRLPSKSKRHELEKAMAGHIIGFGEWTIQYERKNNSL